MNMISIITVSYNASSCIEKTIQSVINQSYENIEYIIVDGGSTDGTLDIVNKYKDKIDIFVSERDNGLYDAMNKAIDFAHGEWLNFMNAGDVFYSDQVLEDIASSGLMEKADFIYSDFIADNGKAKRQIHQSFSEGKVLHQSLVYKKCLHERYSKYYVTHPYIVSDYLFFAQVKEERTAKFSYPISINDTSGISMQGNWINYQRICADYMLRRIGVSGLFFGIAKRIVIDFIKLIIRR